MGMCLEQWHYKSLTLVQTLDDWKRGSKNKGWLEIVGDALPSIQLPNVLNALHKGENNPRSESTTVDTTASTAAAMETPPSVPELLSNNLDSKKTHADRDEGPRLDSRTAA